MLPSHKHEYIMTPELKNQINVPRRLYDYLNPPSVTDLMSLVVNKPGNFTRTKKISPSYIYYLC